jgi:hypothetical protein
MAEGFSQPDKSKAAFMFDLITHEIQSDGFL